MNKPKGLIFITLDCLRYDRASFNGYKGVKHFNMEWFANRGYVFDNMISVGAQTPQVHASYLTGKYQFEHGLRRMWNSKLNPEVTTIPEMLLEQGWSTACATGFTGLATHYGLDRGFDQVDEDSDISKSWAKNKYGGAQGNDWREWVKGFKYDEEKPLFMWLHYFHGHTGSDPAIPQRYKVVEDKSKSLKRRMFENYDGKFHWFDEKWLPVITDRFYPADYAYIITADHGDDFGKYEIAHGRNLYHETIHIPMIMYYPYMDSKYATRSDKLIQPINVISGMIASFEFGLSCEGMVTEKDFTNPIGEFDTPFAYSESLIDYDCGLGDGSGNLTEKCFKHSVFDGKNKIIYKNPDRLGIGEFHEKSYVEEGKEIVTNNAYQELFKGCKDILEMPEIENPIYEASMDDEIKNQLEGLGYM